VADFNLDHDVARDNAFLLRRGGNSAVTARQLGRERGRDHEHLAFAAQRGLILVTCNARDYRLLHDAWLNWPEVWQMTSRPQHAGILIVPHRAPSGVTPAIGGLIRSVGDPSGLANQLFEWNPRTGLWLRRPSPPARPPGRGEAIGIELAKHPVHPLPVEKGLVISQLFPSRFELGGA
jgi:hypothetical protein